MVTWWHDDMMTWWHDDMMTWWHDGIMISWSHDLMISWSHDLMISWYHDIMISWYHITWCHDVILRENQHKNGRTSETAKAPERGGLRTETAASARARAQVVAAMHIMKAKLHFSQGTPLNVTLPPYFFLPSEVPGLRKKSSRTRSRRGTKKIFFRVAKVRANMFPD